MSGYPADPIPMSAVPQLVASPDTTPPQLPPSFKCTALLHPFAPPPQDNPPYCPFYQLCTATLAFSDGDFFSLQIKGAEYGTFWYLIRPGSVQLQVDGGDWVEQENTGWTMPTRNWLVGTNPGCAGVSPMNWIDQSNARSSSWWKYAIPGATRSKSPGATWVWFDSTSPLDAAVPQRIMFGVQPPTPFTGDGYQLAVLQNFSFSYFTKFEPGPVTQPSSWEDPSVEGFSRGNPFGYKPFLWRQNQGITAFMTPVNEDYDPLPTRVLYRWDPDAAFQNGGHRGQNTLLHYDYPNQDHHSLELAILRRNAPNDAAQGYNAYYFNDQEPGCENQIDTKKSGPFPFGTEPPDWVVLGDGKIHGTLGSNPELGPDTNINIWGVMFPPAHNYPQGTYLWTWYAPLSPDGVESRPVVFMQSASALGVGTSLALADYFYFEPYSQPIDPAFFEIPPPNELTFS